MPYVHGRTAEDLLKAEGKLPVGQATQILREVASALAFAHGKGIVHRDVRPANVLWDEERSRARLTDFGIAAVINLSGTETTRLTKTGQLLGEPMHLSPEQLLDEGISELADMYLFGILGYELLAGRGPYDARTPTEWINAHLNKEPRDLKELRPDAPAELAQLLRRCLAKQPQHRPSAKDVARALEGPAAPGAAVSPGTTSTPGSVDLEELVRRRVPHIVLFTVGFGVVLIGLADAVDEYFPDGFKLLVVIFAVAAVLASAVIAWFHGEKGKQRAPAIEYVFLGLITVLWLVVSVMTVL
jgi:serine/threonine-protein kinase